MSNNQLWSNLMGGFAMNNPRNIITIRCLKQDILCLSISIKLLGSNIGSSVLITSGTLNGLVTTFITCLPRDYKNTVILTFHMRKLRPLNFGEDLMLSALSLTTKIADKVLSRNDHSHTLSRAHSDLIGWMIASSCWSYWSRMSLKSSRTNTWWSILKQNNTTLLIQERRTTAPSMITRVTGLLNVSPFVCTLKI